MGAGLATVDETVLLNVWADAHAGPVWRRVPTLLGALGRVPADEVDLLPLGAVAAEVLGLVRPWSGPTLDATVACGRCGVRLQIDVPIGGLLAMYDPDGPTSTAVEVAGRRVALRALRPVDLAAVASAGDEARAEQLLLHRCVVDAGPPTDEDGDDGFDGFDGAVMDEVAAALEALDPLAVVSLEVTCPECGASDAPVADLIGWGWALVDTRVRRLLGDVHRLASAYGWSEPEVLALGPWRRRAYLELVP